MINFLKKVLDWLKSQLSKVSLRTWIEIGVGVLLLAGLLWYHDAYKESESNYRRSKNNEKAYQDQLDSLNSCNTVFQMTIAQLEDNNDSISIKLMETKKALKIKDKELKEANYMLTVISGRTDTISITDTIFREPSFFMDTTLGDRWVSSHVIMRYPNFVSVTPKVVSEKEVLTYVTREYAEAPKKFFLCRWFQKKVDVVKVVVNEENPYITSEKNVFINVVE